MSALSEILQEFRGTAKSEREKGGYFENLVKVFLQNELVYRDMFGGKVFLWPEWRTYWQQISNPNPGARDAGQS